MLFEVCLATSRIARYCFLPRLVNRSIDPANAQKLANIESAVNAAYDMWAKIYYDSVSKADSTKLQSFADTVVLKHLEKARSAAAENVKLAVESYRAALFVVEREMSPIIAAWPKWFAATLDEAILQVSKK